MIPGSPPCFRSLSTIAAARDGSRTMASTELCFDCHRYNTYANDGASSTAVLLELARDLLRGAQPVERLRGVIDAVVSEYLQLRGAGGGNLKGLCPFHDEKSPSFQVSPSKGLFHCFGCQEGGDTITFVMKVDHLSFSERLVEQQVLVYLSDTTGYIYTIIISYNIIS